MTNWKALKFASFAVLVITALSLVGINFGIVELNEKVFNLVEWRMVLAGGLGFVLYAFNRLVSMR